MNKVESGKIRWGMVIDLRRCIGCHSCSVACKLENQVPLGVFRTWVKIVEKGVFPNVRRTFLPMNCNNCEKPVCIEVCPVKATYQREDGIVLVDPHRCIGCQYCKAACPYEVRYKDPLRNIISKCFWCHHLVDAGLKPACIEACPAGARTFGNLLDPESEISLLISREPVQVIHPQHGTKPQVYYIGFDQDALEIRAARDHI